MAEQRTDEQHTGEEQAEERTTDAEQPAAGGDRGPTSEADATTQADMGLVGGTGAVEGTGTEQPHGTEEGRSGDARH